MYEPIVQFIALLRESDVKVSTSEELDCLNALLFTAISDRQQFFLALRSTLIKTQSDYAVFLRLFKEFFLTQKRESNPTTPELIKQMGIKPKKGLQALTDVPKPNTKARGGGRKQGKKNCEEKLDLLPEEWQKVMDLLNQSHLKGNPSDELVFKLFTRSKDELKKLAFQMVRKQKVKSQSIGRDNSFNTLNQKIAKQLHPIKSSIGNAMESIPKNIDWTRVNLRLSKLLFKALPIIKDKARVRVFTQRVLFNLEYFKNILLLAVKLEATYGERTSLKIYPKEADLESMKKPFQHLNLHPSKELQRVVERLAYKIATRASLRNKSLSRGKINIKQTIRRSLKYAGHPMVLKFKKRRVTKPDIMLLCDISGSVRYAVQFFLLLLSHFAIAFSKVQCFVFVSLIDRLPIRTPSSNLNEINHSLNEANVDHYGYSDFGAAFSKFNELYGCDLTRKTTIIILGDARNNRKPSRAEILGHWKSKISKLIWLNPESKQKWDTGDSIMSAYAKYCDVVSECSNLDQLLKFIDTSLL